jgi:SAM-dependent methyltransferase
VALAVATAEYHLERPIRSVLDIGCGEGAWRAPLLKLRPKLHYLGFDASAYAIAPLRPRAQPAPRDLRRLPAPAPLPACRPAGLCDVLHYLPTRELERGLPALAELCGGVAFIEAFAREDEAVGDDDDFKRRPAAFYTTRLRARACAPWVRIAGCRRRSQAR